MSFIQEGKIHLIKDTEVKGDNFNTRELILETEGKYPQFIKFQFTQDRCDSLDSFFQGQPVKVYFDLRGREWNEKFFTNLNGWKIEPSAEKTATQEIAAKSSMTEPQKAAPMGDDKDDLPF